MTAQAIYLGIVFLVVFVFAALAVHWLYPNLVRERLLNVVGAAPGEAVAPEHPGWVQRIVKLTGPLARLSIPEEGWENSVMRIRFMNAGFRAASAAPVYFAAKTVLAIGFAVLWFIAATTSGLRWPPQWFLVSVVAAGAVGYYLPNAVLSHLRARRQLAIFEAFPDAIDLMTVCVEAGLGLDGALLRVADEMEIASVELSEELHLVSLELRAGSSKEKALRNLALRTGVEEVDTLVAMLVQAETFGTSIADSLRVHAEGLRTKRRQRAEEAAAKIPVKLLFPLIFCIFPTMLLVLLGPALLRIYRVLLPSVGGE